MLAADCYVTALLEYLIEHSIRVYQSFQSLSAKISMVMPAIYSR